MTGITVDGTNYDVIVASDLTRSFEIMEGPLSGEALSGTTIRDIKGTKYSYTLMIEPIKGSESSYDALYEVLSAPVSSHEMILPYGQTTIEFDAMIYSGEDHIRKRNGTKNKWSGLKIQFVPIAPQRT